MRPKIWIEDEEHDPRKDDPADEIKDKLTVHLLLINRQKEMDQDSQANNRIYIFAGGRDPQENSR